MSALPNITEFVGARINRHLDEHGYMIPRKQGVNINVRGCNWIDADIRAVDDDSVTICRMGGFIEVIPMADIKHMFIEDLDA
jgi:phage major head subunit gpT-like protein